MELKKKKKIIYKKDKIEKKMQNKIKEIIIIIIPLIPLKFYLEWQFYKKDSF